MLSRLYLQTVTDYPVLASVIVSVERLKVPFRLTNAPKIARKLRANRHSREIRYRFANPARKRRLHLANSPSFVSESAQKDGLGPGPVPRHALGPSYAVLEASGAGQGQGQGQGRGRGRGRGGGGAGAGAGRGGAGSPPLVGDARAIHAPCQLTRRTLYKRSLFKCSLYTCSLHACSLVKCSLYKRSRVLTRTLFQGSLLTRVSKCAAPASYAKRSSLHARC